MMFILQGCGTEEFTNKQVDALVNKGRPILEEFVSSLPEEAHITDVSVIYGGNQGEPSFSVKYPSNIVQATFSVEDKHYVAIVNLEDGKVYSNYDSIDPNELILSQLQKYCDKYELNGTCNVSGAFYSYVFVSHQLEVSKGDVRDVYVYLDNIPDLALMDNTDEYVNASISGFDIEYKAEYNEVFEPEILYEYLADTGNYCKENIRGSNGEYHINSASLEQNYVNGEPAYYEMDIISEGNPDTMKMDFLRWDYKEEDDFCYFYVGGIKSGNIKNIKSEAYIEYECPFVCRGNEITFVRDDNNPYEGHLYTRHSDWNEIVMTRYRFANISLDEKTNDIVDRWELEPINQEEIELVKINSADLFDLVIKSTQDKCEFIDDKVVITFE